jgi:hypothetical protein
MRSIPSTSSSILLRAYWSAVSLPSLAADRGLSRPLLGEAAVFHVGRHPLRDELHRLRAAPDDVRGVAKLLGEAREEGRRELGDLRLSTNLLVVERALMDLLDLVDGAGSEPLDDVLAVEAVEVLGGELPVRPLDRALVIRAQVASQDSVPGFAGDRPSERLIAHDAPELEGERRRA